MRNYGFDLAIGSYICYVDGDDWIEPTLCSDMLYVMEGTKVDFCSFGFDFCRDNGSVLKKISNFKNKFLYGQDIFRAAMLDDDIYTVVWNKVYRRSFLLEHCLYFPNVKIWEDIFYTRKVAYFSQSTSFESKVYYHALVRPGSASRNITEILFLNGLDLLRLERDFIFSRTKAHKYKNLFEAHFVKQLTFFW